MKPSLVFGAGLGLALAFGSALAGFFVSERVAASVPAIRVSAERLTDIPLLRPRGEVEGLVILVSDRGGIGPRELGLEADLRRRGLAVLPVDLETWRDKLDAADGECLYLGSDIENLAKEALRTMGGGFYFHPVVAGVGEGGTLAYAAIADAPAATLAGAVALDAAPVLRTRLPTCPGAVATPQADGGFAYALNAPLPDPATFVAADMPMGLAAGAAAGHAFADAQTAADAPARDRLAVNRIAALAQADAASGALPVVDIPAVGTPQAVVLFYSGDGGWRDLDKTIGDALARSGVHVVGVDSLRYFWTERKPAEIARDAATVLRAADPSGKLPLAVFGYSFGANTFPFAWDRLPEPLRARIRMVGLLGTEATTPFQVTVGDWLGLGGDNAVAPEVAKIPRDKLLCVYGEDETLSICRDPALQGMEALQLEGGHHFDGDYEALAAKLLDGLRKRVAAGA